MAGKTFSSGVNDKERFTDFVVNFTGYGGHGQLSFEEGNKPNSWQRGVG
jgi:hypothetical protein